MRSFSFTIMSKPVILIVAFAASCFIWSVSTTAQAGEDDLKAVHPNVISKAINQPCPAGFDKQFKVLLVVPKGSKIYQALDLKMALVGGDVLEVRGQRISARVYEYFATPRSRKATIDLYNLRYIAVYANYSGHTLDFRLGRTCMSRQP